jgi:superfamily I DNA and RNA helicase
VPKIESTFGWETNVSFESKARDANKFFISNINNAKGLEFPFVICFAKALTRNSSFRNALYTMMARSFIESHLILNESADSPVINSITQGLDYLIKNNKMDVRKPSQEEIEKQNDFIVLDEAVSVEGLVKSFCKSRGATPRHIAKLIGRLKAC